jgi:putative membrane protein
MIRAAMLVVAMAFGLEPSLAQAPKDAPSVDQPATKTYLREAAIADMFGVESGKLALDKASREEVRQFARLTIDQRSAGLRKLRDMTSSAQLESQMPKTVDKVHESKLEELRSVQGAEFDRTYLDMQVKAHETALTLHSAYARATQDGPLKSYADETAALIERHLTELRSLAKLAPARS